MKKIFPYLIVLLCVVAAAIPALASQAETAQAEAEPGLILDGDIVTESTPQDIATPTPKPAVDASDSDITVVYTGTAKPVIKVGEQEIGTSVIGKVAEPITFTVTSPTACRLYYESTKFPQTPLEAAYVSENTYDLKIGFCWSKMTVTVGVAGDLNSDGVLDSGDYDALKNYLTAGNEPIGMTALLADVNGDGELNTADLTAIKAQIKDIRDIEW